MKRLILRLATALLTFLIGVVITALLTGRQFRSIKTVQIASPTVTELKVKLHHPEGWKKIDADNKFSFYLRPDLKEVDVLGCPFGIRKYFGNESFMVGYDYIPDGVRQYSRREKSFCELLEGSLGDQTLYRGLEVEVGGRRARQTLWQWDNPKYTRIMLCFPDLGDGTILKFDAYFDDERAMDEAKEIFASIEFGD